MRDLILENKAEAARDLLLAQAKVEVARELLGRYDDRYPAQPTCTCETTEGVCETESVETEIIDGELEAV